MKRTAIIIAIVLFLTSCFNQDKYSNVDPNNVIGFTVSDTSLIGDNKTPALVRVKISDNADVTRRKIKFTTDHGVFKDNKSDTISVIAGSDFIARTQLVSSDTGLANVIAVVHNVEAKKVLAVNFIRAYPEVMLLAVNVVNIAPGNANSVTITASLSRHDGGLPSSGQIVDFSAADSLGNRVGFFLNGLARTRTDGKGNASIVFSAGNTRTSLIRFSARSKMLVNDSVRANTYIHVSK